MIGFLFSSSQSIRQLLLILHAMYSSQVHEMAMVSAIQEAQKDNLRSYNDYMLKVLEVSVTYWVHWMLL